MTNSGLQSTQILALMLPQIILVARNLFSELDANNECSKSLSFELWCSKSSSFNRITLISYVNAKKRLGLHLHYQLIVTVSQSH
jgi:hypothetical protein